MPSVIPWARRTANDMVAEVLPLSRDESGHFKIASLSASAPRDANQLPLEPTILLCRSSKSKGYPSCTFFAARREALRGDISAQTKLFPSFHPEHQGFEHQRNPTVGSNPRRPNVCGDYTSHVLVPSMCRGAVTRRSAPYKQNNG